MRTKIAIALFGIFLLSANVFAAAKELVGNNFQFYITDNRSGIGIDAATVEVNGTAVCVTTKGFCEKVLEYANGERVTITVTADEYPKKKINTNLTSDEPNLIGLDKPSRGRRPTASPFGFVSFSYVDSAFISVQNPDGREIPIDFTVLVQDVANARIPNAQVKATDYNGKTKTLTTDRNGRCRFQKFQQGRIKIFATATGFVNASVDQVVVNKEEVPITLRVAQR